MKNALSRWLILFFVFTAFPVFSAEVPARIKYISVSAIYLDLGRGAGIQVGDKVVVKRGAEMVADLEVMYISENSSSCKLLSTTGELRVGDEASVSITPPKAPAPVEPVVTPDTTATLTSATQIAGNQPSKLTASIAGRIRGRASFQIYHQSARDGRGYTEPSVYLQTEAEDVLRTGVSFNLRLRARQVDQSGTSRWNNRFYEISLERESDSSPLSWSLGRLAFSRAPGIGYLDGASVEYRFDPRWRAGSFVGFNPEWGGGATQFDRKKGGGYVRFESGDYSEPRRLATTAALAGTYNGSTSEREFLYLENDLTLSRRFSIYQSSELEVNRGWRKTAEGSSLKLSSFMISGRWSVGNSLNFSFGYDDQTPYRDWESRSLPDSLFDEALRQGFRLGMSTRLPWNFRFSINGNADLTHGQDAATSGSISISQTNLLGTRINSSLRYNIFSSPTTEGWQPTLTLSRNIYRSIDLTLQGGLNSYQLKRSGQPDTNSSWARLGTDYWFGRKIYGSASYEVQRGGGWDAERIFFDLGVRL